MGQRRVAHRLVRVRRADPAAAQLQRVREHRDAVVRFRAAALRRVPRHHLVGEIQERRAAAALVIRPLLAEVRVHPDLQPRHVAGRLHDHRLVVAQPDPDLRARPVGVVRAAGVRGVRRLRGEDRCAQGPRDVHPAVVPHRHALQRVHLDGRKPGGRQAPEGGGDRIRRPVGHRHRLVGRRRRAQREAHRRARHRDRRRRLVRARHLDREPGGPRHRARVQRLVVVERHLRPVRAHPSAQERRPGVLRLVYHRMVVQAARLDAARRALDRVARRILRTVAHRHRVAADDVLHFHGHHVAARRDFCHTDRIQRGIVRPGLLVRPVRPGGRLVHAVHRDREMFHRRLRVRVQRLVVPDPKFIAILDYQGARRLRARRERRIVGHRVAGQGDRLVARRVLDGVVRRVLGAVGHRHRVAGPHRRAQRQLNVAVRKGDGRGRLVGAVHRHREMVRARDRVRVHSQVVVERHKFSIQGPDGAPERRAHKRRSVGHRVVGQGGRLVARRVLDRVLGRISRAVAHRHPVAAVDARHGHGQAAADHRDRIQRGIVRPGLLVRPVRPGGRLVGAVHRDREMAHGRRRVRVQRLVVSERQRRRPGPLHHGARHRRRGVVGDHVADQPQPEGVVAAVGGVPAATGSCPKAMVPEAPPRLPARILRVRRRAPHEIVV